MGHLIVELIEGLGLAGVALLMFVETVFPPVPSEVIMGVAGVHAARGQFPLAGAIAAGTAGAMAGNTLWYGLARLLGLVRLRPIVDRFGRWLTLDWAEVTRGEALFERWDRWFVGLGRMVPTIRSLVSIPAGLARMPFGRFLLWSTLGTLGWTAALAIAGHQLGSRYAEIDRWVGPVSTAVIAAVGLWYLWRVATWRPRR